MAQATHVLEAHLEKANEKKTALLKCLADATQDRKRKMTLTKKNNKFEWRLQLAKALNDTDELKLLLDDIKLAPRTMKTRRRRKTKLSKLFIRLLC